MVARNPFLSLPHLARYVSFEDILVHHMAIRYCPAGAPSSISDGRHEAIQAEEQTPSNFTGHG
jgi:hypothetical protein